MPLIDKNKLDVTIIESTEQELSVLNALGDDFKKYSEMTDHDRAFLNSLILRKKPKKVLEIGVSKGGSSIVILNAIKDIPESHLYSIDIRENCYCMPEHKTGFAVEAFPELKKKWTLYTGGIAADFLDEIGGDIDLCLIDTVHALPGEVFDFLMALPYLKSDAIIIFHDTNIHLRKDRERHFQIVNNILISSISGRKIIPGHKNIISAFGKYFNNIGAIQTDKSTFTNIYEIFNILTIKWTYMPDESILSPFKAFLKTFYNEYYVDYFEAVLESQQLNFIKQSVVIQHKPKINLAQKIFSIKNEMGKQYKHKVLRLCGVKIKMKVKECAK